MLFGIVPKACCPYNSMQKTGITPLHGRPWVRVRGCATGICKARSVTKGHLPVESAPRRMLEKRKRRSPVPCGVMRLFRAASRHMSGLGVIVAICSIGGGVYGWEAHAHYAAAYACVLGLLCSLGVALGRRAIRCNAVVPGLIDPARALDAANSPGPDGLRQSVNPVTLQRGRSRR